MERHECVEKAKEKASNDENVENKVYGERLILTLTIDGK